MGRNRRHAPGESPRPRRPEFFAVLHEHRREARAARQLLDPPDRARNGQSEGRGRDGGALHLVRADRPGVRRSPGRARHHGVRARRQSGPREHPPVSRRVGKSTGHSSSSSRARSRPFPTASPCSSSSRATDVLVNRAKVTRANVAAANDIIHVIDKVLLPTVEPTIDQQHSSTSSSSTVVSRSSLQALEVHRSRRRGRRRRPVHPLRADRRGVHVPARRVRDQRRAASRESRSVEHPPLPRARQPRGRRSAAPNAARSDDARGRRT